MRSSGVRNEAEAIGAEIARLVAGGVDPADRDRSERTRDQWSGASGRDYRHGIPVALESETAVRETTVGASILSILKAVRPEAGPRPALEWLRSPIGPDRETVDEVELESAVTSDASADAVIGRLRKAGAGDPAGWKELKAAIRVEGAGQRNSRAARARTRAGRCWRRHTAEMPSAATVIETQAGTAIARAVSEIEEIRDRRGTGSTKSRPRSSRGRWGCGRYRLPEQCESRVRTAFAPSASSTSSWPRSRKAASTTWTAPVRLCRRPTGPDRHARTH